MKILFPMKTMNITQGINIGTHVLSNAIDIAGRDTGIEDLYAPFDGVVKKTWANGNTVWLESLAPVEFADGTTDFATVMLTHDNNIADLPVGRKVKQGEVFYQEGTAGNANGNHVHMEIAKGRFTGTGWFQNRAGFWVLNNSVPPWSAFFVGDDVTIINGAGYPWKKGGDLMIIQNAENWYQRCNKTHWQIRGRELDRATFQGFVGHDFLKFVEACSDDPEADAVQGYQTTGRTAVLDKWDQQIFDLQDQVANLNKRPTQEQMDSLNGQLKTLAEQAEAAKAEVEKVKAETPKAEPIYVTPVPIESAPVVTPTNPKTPSEAVKSATLFVARIGSQVAAARILAEGFAVSINGQVVGLVSGSAVGWFTLALAALLIFWSQFGYQLAQSAGWKWAANLKWPF